VLVDVLVGWPGGEWQATARLVGTIAVAYVLLLWLATVFWAFRDMRARTADPVSLAVGVALVAAFPLFGAALYLLARPRETLADARARELEDAAIRAELAGGEACPACRRTVASDFVFCPHCRTRLREACVNCPQLLAVDWRHCPRCGTSRPAREQVRAVAAPVERVPERPRVSRAAGGGQPRDAAQDRREPGRAPVDDRREPRRGPTAGPRPARREPADEPPPPGQAPPTVGAARRAAGAPEVEPDR
jgi:RNA polymerase subunit RPABC4/transcription elongation factor Spt4